MWVDKEFFYTKRLLRSIAENYHSIYQGFRVSLSRDETNPWRIAEYKADFDMALNSIGRGHWDGELKDIRYFGQLQRVIIFDITQEGIDNPRLKSYAYFLMCKFLNGG